jgi:outer membrane protein OmpA-like peptidoglycan-associated protein
MTLMATYPAYNELSALGFTNVRIKIFVLKEPAEKELHNLIKINGAFADSYFDNSDRLTSNAYIMLDQIVKLMNKYPSLKLEVAVHTDNTGPAETSLELSQLHSRLLVSYLINRGINQKRLVATGFGGSKPIASNLVEKDRKLNRRIDFIIIN